MENHLISKISEEDLLGILSSKLTESKVGHKKISTIIESGKISFDRGRVDKHIEMLKGKGIEIIGSESSFFPRQLGNLQIPPILIYTKGDKSLLKRPMIVLVGTRKYSSYGVKIVDQLIGVIKSRDEFKRIVVVSGLAYGIDAAVHRKALDNGIRTIAVVAGGIGGGFPEVNRSIYRKIIDSDLVLAEFPPGKPIKKGMFPMRNRIMAGLAGSCVVIESPIKSGSLITSSIAMELGRDVYSIPGNIYKDSVAGNNNLLSQGAFMLNSRFDMVDMLERLLDRHSDFCG